MEFEMLPEVKQRLDALRVQGLNGTGWGEILIKHTHDGDSCVGIHHVYGQSEDSNGNEVPGVTWAKDPLLVADDLPTLKIFLENMLKLVDENLITTEEELSQYNKEIDFSNNLR